MARQNVNNNISPIKKARLYLEKNVSFFQHGTFDVVFVCLVMILFTFGIIMMLSASYAYAEYYNGSPFAVFFDQLVSSIAGFAIMVAISFVDYRILNGRLAWVAFFLTIVAMLGAVLQGVILHTATRRWLNFGISIQPSEFAKLTMIIVLAYLMTLLRAPLRAPRGKKAAFHPQSDDLTSLETKIFKRVRGPYSACTVIAIVVFVYCGLVIAQDHLSATILFAFMGYFILMLSGTKKWFFWAVAGLIAAVVAIVLIKPDILSGLTFGTDRITVWLDKNNPEFIDERRQTVNGLYAIGSGGLFGVGFGNSKQKQLYIPEIHNDFVFPVVCEELGFFGAAIVILLFAMLIFRGFKIAKECDDYFGSLLVMGIMIQIALQVIINLAVVTDVFPNTGMVLPFFSSGGSSIMAILMEMGVVLSVSRRSNLTKK